MEIIIIYISYKASLSIKLSMYLAHAYIICIILTHFSHSAFRKCVIVHVCVCVSGLCVRVERSSQSCDRFDYGQKVDAGLCRL